jgi:O-antigen/teichoic acid export membrane protein
MIDRAPLEAVRPMISTASQWLRGALGGGTALVLIGNILARGLGLLFPIVVARLVGREDFGLVYFFINTGFLVAEIVLTGFPTALTRQMAAGDDGRPARPHVAAAVIGGLPLYLAAIVAAIALGRPARADPALIVAVVTGLTIDAYYFAALRGFRRFGLLATYRVGANLAQILLVVLVAAAGAAQVGTIVAIYAFVYLVPIAAIEVLVGPLRSTVAAMARPTRSSILALSRFAIPALISGIAYGVVVGLDVYVVRLLAPGDLPDYAAARAITMPLTMIPFGIGIVLMPRVASSGGTSPRLLRDALALAAGFGVVAVFGYLALSGPIVAILYPPSLSGAAGLAPGLAAAFAVFGCYSVVGAWWFGIGRPAVPATSLVAGALVAIASHAVVTARLGAAGAALSIGVGAGVALALLGARTIARLRT